jgi:DNA processing protein
MSGFAAHNWSAGTPTTSCVPSPIGTIERIESTDQAFPAALRNVAGPLETLWYVGRLPASGQRAVAMVGSRGATRAACDLAAHLAGELGRLGHAVISGGALGIDAAAHRGALATSAPTFAVLGCGVDVVYPDRHERLFADIAASGGGLLSQYPPGYPPRAQQFPVRNRIVAALGQAVLVVEARAASGALITARLGRQMGRPVLAVPGSPGTDELIATGATPVDDLEAVLAALAGRPAPARAVPEALADLVGVLHSGPASAVEVAVRLEVTLSEALGRLAEAELEGWARRLPGGRFEVLRAG